MIHRPMHVMKEFFGVRLQYYDMRKTHLTKKLTEEWEKLDNKVRMIIIVQLHSRVFF